MSRMQIKEEIKKAEQLIFSTINQFKELNDEKNRLGKQCTELSTKIKSYLVDNNLETLDTDLWTVTISRTKNQEVNEMYAIEILKQNLTEEQLKNVIKTKEYIDDDELEKLVYEKILDPKILEPTITPKDDTVRLTVKKRKKA